MLMNQKFSFSENPRGIQEALFLQENDNLEIWLKIDGEEKQLTAGFRKWIRTTSIPETSGISITALLMPLTVPRSGSKLL
ncbi:MAG: hypothetical protein ACLU4P_06675 [Ruminococcus sp.]